jgi:hypothetical protein
LATLTPSDHSSLAGFPIASTLPPIVVPLTKKSETSAAIVALRATLPPASQPPPDRQTDCFRVALARRISALRMPVTPGDETGRDTVVAASRKENGDGRRGDGTNDASQKENGTVGDETVDEAIFNETGDRTGDGAGGGGGSSRGEEEGSCRACESAAAHARRVGGCAPHDASSAARAFDSSRWAPAPARVLPILEVSDDDDDTGTLVHVAAVSSPPPPHRRRSGAEHEDYAVFAGA